MRSNTSPGLKTRLVYLATGVLLVLACSAFGSSPPSPFRALEDAPTPAAREAILKEWRAELPPVSNPITAEERETLVQQFILTHNPAIVEVLGPELILELAKRFRNVAVNGGRYQSLRNALVDAVERTSMPEQIKATGEKALLEGLNSPDLALRDDTMTHLAYRDKEGATDVLLRMIDDPEEQIRGAALELLGKFGRPDAAPVIASKLQQRAKALDERAIQKDFSFASGRDAITQLVARARDANGSRRPDSTPKPEKVAPGVIPGLVRAATAEEVAQLMARAREAGGSPRPDSTPKPEKVAPGVPPVLIPIPQPTPALPKPATPANPNTSAAQAPHPAVDR